MKKYLCIRGISLLLLLVLLFSCASCVNNSTPTEPKSTQRLTVETVEAIYSEQQRADFARSLTDIFARLIYIQEGMALNAEQKEELLAKMSEKYIPLFENEQIRADELEKFLLSAESACSELEQKKKVESDAFAAYKSDTYSLLYRKMVSTIGTQRSGSVAYEALCVYFEDRIEYYKARYGQYGYLWYLSTAQGFEKRLNELRGDLGKDTFSDAMSVIAFSASVVSGTLSVGEDTMGNLLYNGDIKETLKRHSQHFLSLGITEYQWYVMGDVLSFFEDDSSETLSGAILSRAREDGTFARSARCAPRLLTLYAAFVDAIRVEQIEQLKSEQTKEERTRIICEVLSECGDELNLLLDSLSANCVSGGEAYDELIKSFEQEDELEAFRSEYVSVDTVTLCEAISSYAQGNIQYAQIRKSAIGYAASFAPYLVFAYCENAH